MHIEETIAKLTLAINNLSEAIHNGNYSGGSQAAIAEEVIVTGDKETAAEPLKVAGKLTRVWFKDTKTGAVIKAGEEVPVNNGATPVKLTKWNELCEKYNLDKESGEPVTIESPKQSTSGGKSLFEEENSGSASELDPELDSEFDSELDSELDELSSSAEGGKSEGDDLDFGDGATADDDLDFGEPEPKKEEVDYLKLTDALREVSKTLGREKVRVLVSKFKNSSGNACTNTNQLRESDYPEIYAKAKEMLEA